MGVSPGKKKRLWKTEEGICKTKYVRISYEVIKSAVNKQESRAFPALLAFFWPQKNDTPNGGETALSAIRVRPLVVQKTWQEKSHLRVKTIISSVHVAITPGARA